MKRVVKLAVLLICLVTVAVCLGAFYNTLVLRRLQQAHAVPGAFYSVAGHSMHLYCTGTGSPTVILEGGLGDDWTYWQKVQPEIAKTTRICSYDRAGLGWSEPQSAPQDAEVVSLHLHSLLKAAHEPGSYVLAGASAGGFYVRQFFFKFPEDVAGVVLVDSGVPEQLTVFPGRMDTPQNRRKRHRDANWQWLREMSGYARLTGAAEGTQRKAWRAMHRWWPPRPVAPVSRPHGFPSTTASGLLPMKLQMLIAALLVISQDPDRPKDGWNAQSIPQQPMWSQLQDDLKRLSPHSRRIIAKLSGHHVMIDRPNVVISGIQQLITDVRQHQADPRDGTTLRQ